jgi:hypothetical protein
MSSPRFPDLAASHAKRINHALDHRWQELAGEKLCPPRDAPARGAGQREVRILERCVFKLLTLAGASPGACHNIS